MCWATTSPGPRTSSRRSGGRATATGRAGRGEGGGGERATTEGGRGGGGADQGPARHPRGASGCTRSTDYLDGDDAGVGRVRVQRWAPFAPLPRTYSIAALPPPAAAVAAAAEYKDSDNIIMLIC